MSKLVLTFICQNVFQAFRVTKNIPSDWLLGIFMLKNEMSCYCFQCKGSISMILMIFLPVLPSDNLV